jgi:hypothetical protein
LVSYIVALVIYWSLDWSDISWRLSFVGYLIDQLYRGKFHFSVYWLVSYIVALVIYRLLDWSDISWRLSFVG